MNDRQQRLLDISVACGPGQHVERLDLHPDRATEAARTRAAQQPTPRVVATAAGATRKATARRARVASEAARGQAIEATKQEANEAMTFQEIWTSLCKKRPLLNDPNATVEVSSEGFRKLLRQVYEQGQKSVTVKPEKSGGMFDDLFSNLCK